MEINQSPEERKKFLAELNKTVLYTGEILHGEELSKVRIRQLKKYVNGNKCQKKQGICSQH